MEKVEEALKACWDSILTPEQAIEVRKIIEKED